MLILLMVGTTCGSYVMADMNQQKTADGLCEHHPEHTADCGYAEATESSPCTHEHTEDCYTTDENGEQILNCQHVHDETCGYKEAAQESPCTYVCDICNGNVDGDGNTVPTEDENNDADGQSAETAVQITSWAWVDEEEMLQEMDGGWGLGLPGASEENPLTQDLLLEMLPKQITAETKTSDTQGTEAAQTGEAALDLAWDLSSMPEEGIWSGDHVFTAGLPEGYALAEGVQELSVTVQLGGAMTYASQPNLNANKVEGVSPRGTTINVFDYWLNTQDASDQSNPYDFENRGINSGEVLKFGAGMGESTNTSENNLNTTTVNQWTKSSAVRTGIVSSTLTDGYPTLSSRLNGGSLAYLFDPAVSHDGKASYPDATGLLQVDSDGYFYYNSKQNFAELDKSSSSFTLYNTWGVEQGGQSPPGQFFPFNTGAQVFDDTRGNGITQKNDLTSTNAIINHYFGLTMTTRFVQQYGGHTEENGDVVTYDFSGDDDVWVFIDDVLVADLGGIHNAASLSIDFSTGIIKVNGSQTGTLRSMYQQAGRESSTTWIGNTFADNTYHTLNFFYLERGNTDSNMYLKFNLVTVPESGVIKVDQAGNHIAGAEFSLYQTEADYEVAQGAAPICSGTTDADGELIFVDDQGMIISLNDLYNRGIEYMVLRETKTPSGYRSAGDMNLRFYEAHNGNVVVLSSNEWETGSYASSKVTAQSDATVTSAEGNRTANLDQGGKMFAVVLQKQEDGSWKAVSGDPENGWNVSDSGSTMAGVIEAAQANPYEFSITASGAYEVNIENLPGDVTKYYYMLASGQQQDALYTVAYYYTSASSVAGATAGNTWQVASDEFDRVFSVSLYVANVQNNLYVQKLDEEGNPVSAQTNGSATFALYDADDVTVDSDGSYTIAGNAQPVMTQSTSDMESPLPLDGGAMFSRIPLGTYYLIETQAPSGYLVNGTAVPVVVDNSGIYADAGSAEDAVSVRRGVGSIVRSMVQFAADDDIDATLHDIKATLYTSEGEYSGNMNWSGPSGEALHLQYNNANQVLDYGPLTSDGVSYFEVEENWSKLEIHQCMDEQHTSETSSPKQDLINDEGDPDLVNLFSGTVTVRVRDQRVGSLQISKTVTGENAPADTSFAFEVELKDLTGAALNGTFATSTGDGSQGTITFTDGKAQVTLKHGESLTITNLPVGTAYTVKEIDIPAGFTPSVTTGGAEGATDTASGTIAHNSTAAVGFTNTYSNNVTINPEGQKTLDGRNLTAGDAYGFTLTPDDAAEAAIADGSITVADSYNTASVTGDGTGKTAGFTFGDITFKTAGSYTFTITENLPQGVSADNPVADGIKYDTHSAVVTVTVTADETTGLLSADVVYSNTGAPFESDEDRTDLAAFTNQVVGSFSFTKTDRDGMDGNRLSGASFAIYRLTCSDSSHDHDSSLIDVANSETGAIDTEYEYADCWELTAVKTSGSDGSVSFTNLPVSGEYRLAEIKAPDGYTIPTGQWRIAYDADEGAFAPLENAAVGKPVAIGTSDSGYYIVNYRPGELPFAGNTGIRMFLLIGGILMAAGAAGTFWYLRRKRRMA